MKSTSQIIRDHIEDPIGIGGAMVIEIPRTAPSLNKTLRLHWTRRHKLQDLWQQEIGWALNMAHHNFYGQPSPKARVSIDRRSPRTLDPDNLAGSCKPILDALRWAHVLVDDTPEHLELVVTQSKGQPRTRIEVRAIGAAKVL